MTRPTLRLPVPESVTVEQVRQVLQLLGLGDADVEVLSLDADAMRVTVGYLATTGGVTRSLSAMLVVPITRERPPSGVASRP